MGVILFFKEWLEVVFEVMNEVICLSLFGVMIIMIVYIFIFSLIGVEGKMFYLMVVIVILVLLVVMVFLIIIVFVVVVMFMLGKVSEKVSLIIIGVKLVYCFVLEWVLKL